MDRSNLIICSDPSPLRASSPRKDAGKKSYEGDLGEKSNGAKRPKLSNPELMLHSEGARTCKMEFLTKKEAQALLHPCNKEEACQITAEALPLLSDRIGMPSVDHSWPEQDAACLRQVHTGGKTSSVNVQYDDPPKEMKGQDCHTIVGGRKETRSRRSMELSLDLNVADNLNMAEHNPFYPYKKLGQVKISDASECGSTTGTLEDTEQLRKSNEMKLNGFLSSSCGRTAIPKPCGQQPRKRKDGELKWKSGSAPKEQVNRLMKVTAPSELFSGLNLGIINHVRNRKQIYSIIKAIVQSEEHDGQNHRNFANQVGQGSREVTERLERSAHSAMSNYFDLPVSKTSVARSSGCGTETNDFHMVEQKSYEGMPTTSESTSMDDDSLNLKLSSVVTMPSERANSPSTDDLSANQDYITSLSLKAATVACHWLELLKEDIKLRLSALKHSRKRVTNAVQTVLPYLLSTEISCNQGNDPSVAHASLTGSSEMHVERWMSLFNQMDKALYEEGTYLENRLGQVQEMQSHCKNGLEYIGSIGEFRKLKSKSSEAFEMECAVRAAAASIYSTCNLIMTT